MKKNESAQDQLLTAFIALISEVGAHQVTLQKVAKKAKVPFSTAHYYYGGNWDRIFSDAVVKVGTNAQIFIATYLQKNSGPKSNPIELYISGTFEWIKVCKEDSRLWLFNYYFSSLKKEFTIQQSEFISVARKRVLSLLYEAKGRGHYKSLEVSPEKADLIHTLVMGLGIMAMIQNLDPKKINELRLEALRQVHSVLS